MLSASETSQYRSDIDGLRGIAILSVIFFHAIPSLFPGGYIGVDIFFVISGFLITKSINNDLNSNNFKFTNFYIKRILRLYPALIFVLILCLIFGWFALLADEYKQLGLHVFSASSFTSNLVLWSESGYFDNSSISKPLLHLWSLGVEEQFYLLWPGIIYIMYRGNIGLIKFTILMLFLSFAINIELSKYNLAAAFYFPLSRFWEMLLGSLVFTLNCAIKIPKNKGKSIKNLISLVGYLLLILGFILITEKTTYPKYSVLLPVFGAVFIIASGEDSYLNKNILCNKYLIFFGALSYQIYLFHWPVISFIYIIDGKIPNTVVKIISLISSVILAFLFDRFIQKSIFMERFII